MLSFKRLPQKPYIFIWLEAFSPLRVPILVSNCFGLIMVSEQLQEPGYRKLGFRQSMFDPCLWFHPDIFLIQYVDNLGLAFCKQSTCDKFLADIHNLNFTLTVEESFNEYLGISYESMPNDHVNMTQQGLIQKIINTAGMSDCNPNFTPAARETLGIDP